MDHQTPVSRLRVDPSVWFGPLSRDRTFSDFLNLEVPAIVEDYADETLTFGLLIEIQYQIAAAWASRAPSEQNRKIVQMLAGWHDPAKFLWVYSAEYTTEEAYCLQMRQLSVTEYAGLKSGTLTVGELYRKNHTVFLAHLLPKNRYQIN